jgi:hypothetical protein
MQQEASMIRNVCIAGATVFILASGMQVLPSVTFNSAAAQSSTPVQNLIPESEAVTLHAKITAIDPNSRSVTLRSPSGQQVTVTAGPAVRLDLLKVGDTVNVKYYRSVAFAVTPPTTGNAAPTSDNELEAVLAQPVHAPGGVGVAVLKVTGTVVGINMASHTIELVNPAGGPILSVDVTNPSRIAMLGSLKVGDNITAVISQAFAVSIEPSKSWFRFL